MRVLFTSLRVTSHFLPLVPFVEACRRCGHEVAVAAPAELAERVEKTGAAFLPFDHPGDAGLGPIWARMRQASAVEGMQVVIGEIFAGACAKFALPGLLASMERWRPSIVVRESQEYAAIVAAEKFGIPHARVAITGRGAENQLLSIAAPAVDAHRVGLGLSLDPLGERIRNEATLTMFPASFEPPDSSPVLRFRAPRKDVAPLPDWWGSQAGPFVYATLGTVAGNMESRHSAYRVLVDALAGLPIRVLLTIGADVPLEALGEVPSTIHVERFVPQDEVVPHAAAVVCHGGSGTVIGTLAAGVPHGGGAPVCGSAVQRRARRGGGRGPRRATSPFGCGRSARPCPACSTKAPSGPPPAASRTRSPPCRRWMPRAWSSRRWRGPGRPPSRRPRARAIGVNPVAITRWSLSPPRRTKAAPLAAAPA